MFDAESLIHYGGLLIVLLAVFAQTGLFFCFFIPSGGFMFAAGVLTATGSMGHNLLVVCILSAAAAVAGHITGYWLGTKTGGLLSGERKSRWLRPEYLASAERFYAKNGALALAAGPFLPLIRTFAPIVAGMIRMPFSRYMLFTTIGAVAYTFSFTAAGYLIGSMPFLKPYLKPFILVIICVVTIPVVIRIIREFRKKP